MESNHVPPAMAYFFTQGTCNLKNKGTHLAPHCVPPFLLIITRVAAAKPRMVCNLREPPFLAHDTTCKSVLGFFFFFFVIVPRVWLFWCSIRNGGNRFRAAHIVVVCRVMTFDESRWKLVDFNVHLRQCYALKSPAFSLTRDINSASADVSQ